MNEELKFIQLKNTDGKDVLVNISQIVGVKTTEHGCYLSTTNPDFNLALNITVEEVFNMLPSAYKQEEIN